MHGLRTVAAAVTVLPGWDITAVVDPLDDVRRTVAAQFPRARVLAHHDALVETGTLPDLLVLAIPPAATPEVLRALLALPCALLVEKPGAVEASVLETLAERANGRSWPVQCAYSYRQHFTVRAFQQQLPRVGTLQRLSLTFCAPLPVSGWRASRDAGGGALRDLGAHLVDLALHLVPGPWQITNVQLLSRRTPHDDCTLRVQVGAVQLTIRAAYHGAPVFRLEAQGSRGVLAADLWRMVRPATSAGGRLWSQLQTRVVPHFRPGALLQTAYVNTLLAAASGSQAIGSSPLTAATLHDAAAVLRHIALAENAHT